MGSRIAAHFGNAGIPALLLDIPGQPNRNTPAQKGIQNALKQRPGGFFTDEKAALLEPGNFDDDLAKVEECDWIIEAIVEDLEAKRAIWRKVEAARKPDAVLSTNTSGIPLASIAEGFSPGFRRHFLGTHFFNPPRYLHLMELIPGSETDPAILDDVERFADRRLGKGVVRTKDTPNFIANRIGSFMGGTIGKAMLEQDFSIEEVDALTGSLIGVPNTASFRLLDLVGLDVWGFVGTNLYELVPNDPWRERFLPLDFQKTMIEQKWLGDKTGQGFYKKSGGKGDAREILVLDWKTLQYQPLQKPRFPAVEAARNIEDLGERVRTLLRSDDRAGRFLWKVLGDLFLYCSEMIPEISDRIVEIDRAMRWGYGHKLGPFELWDAIGFLEVVSRLEMDHRALPAHIKDALARGIIALYRPPEPRRAVTEYFDFRSNDYQPIEPRFGIFTLRDRKRTHGVIFENAGVSLIDLDDGVLCVEFHSKLNTLGEDTISMVQAGLDVTDRNFDAMIIANEGEAFSAGANLMLVLLMAQEGEWDDLDLAVRRFQQMNMALKYAAKPVVAAPFSRTLGGGCEIVLHCTRAQASAETHIGLVEVAVGVIPAGGGCKELLARLKDPLRVFDLIGYAKVSSSAEDARKLGLLHRSDAISMNPERLIGDAKALALSLVPNYSPAAPAAIPAAGESAYAMMKLGAWSARQGNFITDYEVIIAEKLAHILSGGRLSGAQTVTEQYLLDLEREAFLSLCGNPKTQERMQYMLKTGKPLRN